MRIDNKTKNIAKHLKNNKTPKKYKSTESILEYGEGEKLSVFQNKNKSKKFQKHLTPSFDYTYSAVDTSVAMHTEFETLAAETSFNRLSATAEGDPSGTVPLRVETSVNQPTIFGANMLYMSGAVIGLMGAVGSASTGDTKILEKSVPPRPVITPQVTMLLTVKPAMGPFIAEPGLEITDPKLGKSVEIHAAWDNDQAVFNVELPNNINGILLINISDKNGGEVDYLDEADGKGKDLNGDLHALIYLEEGQSLSSTININPLTEIVYQLVFKYAPKNNDGTVAWGKITTEYIKAKYSLVADLFRIDGVDELLLGEVSFTIDEKGNPVLKDESNEYGKALALISKAEAEQGKSTSEIIDLILKQITDPDGNTKEITSNFALDITAPVALNLTLAEDTGISNADGITNNSKLTIAGLESGAIWQYQINGGNWIVGSGTSFNATEGNNNYSVSQIDSAGNVGNITTLSNINYDIKAPIVLNLTLAEDTGISNTDGITNNSKITIDGLESGASWQYQVDAGDWTNGTLSSFNAISGLHNYSVRQIDSAGNVGNITTLSNVTLDTISPADLSLALAADTGSSNTDGITNNSKLTIAGLEGGATWQYQVDAGDWANGTLSSFNAISGLHNYSVRQIDSAGNVGNITTLSNVTLDKISPADLSLALAADTGSSNTDGITNNSKLTIAGLESGATWQYQVDAGDWTNGTLSSFNAISGLHNYAVRQIDVAGNVGNITVLSNITLDTTAPTLNTSSYTTTNGGDQTGDEIIINLTFSEAINGLNNGDVPDVLIVGNQIVNATWSGIDGVDTRQLKYIITHEHAGLATIDESALKIALLNAGVQDISGNALNVSASIPNIDTSPLPVVNADLPRFSSIAPKYVLNTEAKAGAIIYDANAESRTGVSINNFTISGYDSGLFNIDSSSGEVSFKADPLKASYSFSIMATDTNNKTMTQQVSLEIQSYAIDLGDSNGQLIAPFRSDGELYYFWDKDRSGAIGGFDKFTQNDLDKIFKYNSSGLTNPSSPTDINHEYRYATINGVKLAIPVLGTLVSNQPKQTAIDNNPIGELNPTYDGLAAIWDATGGTYPTEWRNGGIPQPTFWSATPDTTGNHYTFQFGVVNLISSTPNTESHWVCLHVIG